MYKANVWMADLYFKYVLLLNDIRKKPVLDRQISHTGILTVFLGNVNKLDFYLRLMFQSQTFMYQAVILNINFKILSSF